MTGQDIQARLDAVVADLQTKGKGRSVNIMFRNPDNTPNILPLSSDAQGVVDAGQLAAIQAFLAPIIDTADDYETNYAPVSAASETFRTARAVHQGLIDAATAARTALNDTLEADAAYQAAKQALDDARGNQLYIDARQSYDDLNVSENFAALGQARGEYVS